MFTAAWVNVTFIHYELEPAVLQPHVPFALDVRDGKAYVSLVTFTQQKLRLAFGGALTAWAGALVANHDFLNVRTYVRQGSDSGICFLAEWVNNPLALPLGPPWYGLPYRLGRLEFSRGSAAALYFKAAARGGRLVWRGKKASLPGARCSPESLDEFLLERYAAFTERKGVRRRFRVAHEPWQQARVEVEVLDDGLLRANLAWWEGARLVGANYSPGVPVRIGRPVRIKSLGSLTRRWA